jgi:predicted nucleic acid-binding protein
MDRKICIDSDVLISLLNKEQKTKELLESLDADFYLTSVNAFEIWYGRKKSELVFEVLESFNILDLDKNSAKLAGDILRELKNKGEIIDLKDVFIGAICIKNDVSLLTYNKKHFERLKKFGLVLV